MKIIITKYFEKLFNKKIKNVEISELIEKININSKNFINLKTPFFKIKLKINNKSYRLILFSGNDYIKIIFINIFDKKDKNFGENINWNLSQKEIIKFYEKNLLDIEKGEYKIFKKY